MLPVLIVLAGLVVDAAVWTLGSTRLQMAADSAASSALLTLQTSTFQGEGSTQQQSDLKAIVNYEAAAAISPLAGTLTATPTITYDTSGYTWVTVKLNSNAPKFFAGAAGVTAPLLSASATSTMAAPSTAQQTPAPCVLTLGGTGTGINLDNAGSLVGSGCSVFSDSAASGSINVNSGTLKGSSIGTVGSLTLSNSGSNTVNPTVQNFQTKVADPYSGLTAPTPGACNATQNDYSSYGTYSLSPTVWCGDVTIGGNGSTDSFAPGIYYIVNGNLTFNNANITSASGVTFVLTGSNPGNITYTNYSNTYVLSAPTSGPTASVLFWQVCNKNSQQADSFQGGGTMQATGLIYAPCATIDVGNNAQLKGPLNGGFNIVAQSIYVHGSATVQTTPMPVTTTKVPVLTN